MSKKCPTCGQVIKQPSDSKTFSLRVSKHEDINKTTDKIDTLIEKIKNYKNEVNK